MSTIDLPDDVILTYNGYEFPSNAKTIIEGVFIYDEARYTVIATEWKISVRWWVTNIAGTDGDVGEIRKILSKPGALLACDNKGFGNFIINQNIYDIAWGPSPERLRWESSGADKASRLHWECKFTIPACNVSGLDGLLSYNFEREYDVDENRLGTVTMRGHFIIPLTRIGPNNRVIRQSAGQFRDLIKYPMIQGYQRIRESYIESKDKRRLDFTIVDKQLSTNELPFGCAAAGGSHSAQSGLKSLGDGITGQDIRWNGSVSASYTLLPNVPKATGANHFFSFCQTIARAAASRNRTILLHSVRYEEGLYQRNRELSFGMDYVLFAPLEDLVISSGMWKPLPNTESQFYIPYLHQVGLQDLGDYRQTGVKDYPGIIIDVCQNATGIPFIPPALPEKLTSFTKGPSVTENTIRSPQSNWLFWECHVRVLTSPNNVAHLKLKAPTESLRQQSASPRAVSDFKGGGRLSNQLNQQPSPLTFQKRTDSHRLIAIYGEAARYGMPIGIPRLVSVGGRTPVLKRELGDECVPLAGNGAPIVHSWWYLEYWVDLVPNNLQVPTALANVRDGVNLRL